MRESINNVLGSIQTNTGERGGLDDLKKKIRPLLPKNMECSGSTGSGQHTDCVYFRIFDRKVSNMSTSGYHLAYLFSKDGQRVYLSLNARGSNKNSIKTRVVKIQNLLKLDLQNSGMDLKGNADTLSNTARNRQTGDALSIEYRHDNLPDDEHFRNDLLIMIDHYNSLIQMGLKFGNDEEEHPAEEIQEEEKQILDTMLIKLGRSYREGITAEELYNGTSSSWKLSENKLGSGEYKYYCAVYQNKIKEIYEITGYEKDIRPDRIGRFILKGKIAVEQLRAKLLNISIGDIHTSSGNPIRYTSISKLLNLSEHIDENVFDGEMTGNPLLDDDLFLSESMQQKIVRLLKYKKNVILQGPPGVGKTYIAKKVIQKWFSVTSEQMLQVQFHQSYSYEDFIEGYRPNKEGSFELQSGLLKLFVNKAANDGDRAYFVIIDEMNRGNLSKIFGELFMLIEHDKRGENIKLAYSKHNFTVPDNVYFIGTMNTADRSLTNIDFALRRRFSFFYIESAFEDECLPKFSNYLDSHGISAAMIKRIVRNVRKVNEVVTTDYRLGRGFEIGHAYFTNFNHFTDEQEWFENIVEFELIPLIKEYYFDDDTKCMELIEVLLND